MPAKPNEELATLRQQIDAKNREGRKLYALVNRLKGQVTDLEIAVVDRDLTIEDLREAIAGMQKQPEASKEN